MSDLVSCPPVTEYKSFTTRYFAYEHLPPNLQAISKPFSDLATVICNTPTYNVMETEAALRKLLEAKDCAVRAALEPR